ncbi:MAG: Npt1/Npt2 family nucleotide transporter [Acidobacteriota bacterium]|nr:Npt1/Npt2 family nucleotide transporter [Acidobacteriota bacterium]
MTNSTEPGTVLTALTRILRLAVDVREEEVRALLWSCLYFFCILSSYYIIRPIRDDMGVAGGVRNLPWLFTGTLIVMLAVNPLFSALVAKMKRTRFIPMTYRFFMANLLLFFVLLKVLPQEQVVWVGRAFFIWTSVFNLFVVSIFWAVMSDVFQASQSKRLFGFIGAGGTLGSLVGAAITATFAEVLGPVQLLIISIVLLEIGVWCIRGLSRHLVESSQSGKQWAKEEPIGGGILTAIPHIVRSGYLLSICAYMLLYTIAATFLYFQQADLVDQAFSDRAARTAFFAKIDLVVNALTLLTQLFLTSRIIRLLGVSLTLTLLPAVCVIGFASLGFFPTLAVLVVFQVFRRASNFALARPARETLYTVVSSEDKYKSKSLIDTFVYRAGDQVGAWSYSLMGWLGLSMAGIAFAAVPLAGLWWICGFWLGRRQTVMARDCEIRAGTSTSSP